MLRCAIIVWFGCVFFDCLSVLLLLWLCAGSCVNFTWRFALLGWWFAYCGLCGFVGLCFVCFSFGVVCGWLV